MQLPPRRFHLKWGMVAVAAFGLGLAIAPAGAPYLALLVPMAAASARLAPMILLLPALVVLALLAIAEILLAVPVPLWLYLPVAIALSGPAWPGRDWRESPKRLAPLGFVCVSIAALYLVPWSSRKPFLHSLFSIKSGMTVAEVRRTMAGFMVMEGEGMTPPNSARQLSDSGSLVFRHSDDGYYNADCGVVTFGGGRVVSVEFHPD